MSPAPLAERWLLEGAEESGLQLTREQISIFFRYRDLLRTANKTYNLTALGSDEEIIIKHFLDSLSGRLLFHSQPEEAVLDLGPGGGFPSLPLALVDGSFSLLLLEPRQHPADFLEQLIALFSLGKAFVVRQRAESFARGEGRGVFDWVLARAVARLNVLLELSLPLLRQGGHLLAWKGDSIDEELAGAEYALEELGGEVEAIQPLTLPHWGLQRNLVLVRKVLPTPERYPRRVGIPQKRPLEGHIFR